MATVDFSTTYGSTLAAIYQQVTESMRKSVSTNRVGLEQILRIGQKLQLAEQNIENAHRFFLGKKSSLVNQLAYDQLAKLAKQFTEGTPQQLDQLEDWLSNLVTERGPIVNQSFLSEVTPSCHVAAMTQTIVLKGVFPAIDLPGVEPKLVLNDVECTFLAGNRESLTFNRPPEVFPPSENIHLHSLIEGHLVMKFDPTIFSERTRTMAESIHRFSLAALPLCPGTALVKWVHGEEQDSDDEEELFLERTEFIIDLVYGSSRYLQTFPGERLGSITLKLYDGTERILGPSPDNTSPFALTKSPRGGSWVLQVVYPTLIS